MFGGSVFRIRAFFSAAAQFGMHGDVTVSHAGDVCPSLRLYVCPSYAGIQ